MFKSNSISSLLNSVLGTSTHPQNPSHVILQRLGVKGDDEDLRNFVVKLEKSRKICFQAEEDFVQKQWTAWMSRLSSPKLSHNTRLHIIKLALIASSRGHTVKNLTMEAIKLCNSEDLASQRLGVLYLTRMESSNSESLLMVINMAIQKLGSSNIGIKCISFNLLSLLSPISSISKSFSSIVRGLEHCQPRIRRKSALSLITLARTRRDEDFIVFFVPKLIQLLGDKNFSVSLASVQSLSTIVKTSPNFEENTQLRDSIAVVCANILAACMSGRIPSHYDLENVKAPFVQVQVLNMLSGLASEEWKVPDVVLPVLKDVLEQKHSGDNYIIYMALLEGIRAVCSLGPKTELIHDALRVLMSFLQSPIADVRVIGLRAASNVFSTIGPVFTTKHLVTILKCLKCSHKSIRKNTIQLVFSMANQHNYKTVCSTLESVMVDSIDSSFIEETENQIAKVIIEHCDDLDWLLESQLNRKNFLRDDLLHFISEKTESLLDQDKKDKWLLSCQSAVDKLLETPNLRYNQFVTCASLMKVLAEQATHKNLTTFTSLFMDHDDFTTFHPSIVEFFVFFGMREEYHKTSVFVLGYLKSNVLFQYKYLVERAEQQLNNFEMYNKTVEDAVDDEDHDLSFSFLDDIVKADTNTDDPVWISISPPNESESIRSLGSSGSKTVESFSDVDGFEVSWSAEGRVVKYKGKPAICPIDKSLSCSSVEIADEADEEKIREIEKEQKLAEALFQGFSLTNF